MSLESLNEILTLLASVLLDGMVTLLIIRRLHASQLLININTYSLLLFNFLILFLCYTLSQLELSFGAGLGLFALLAILRFRSQVMKIDELIVHRYTDSLHYLLRIQHLSLHQFAFNVVRFLYFLHHA